MPVTERLILPVQSGADWKEPLKFLLQTLKKQEGNIRTRWGPHSENADNLELFIGKFSSPPRYRSARLTNRRLGVYRSTNRLPKLRGLQDRHGKPQANSSRRAYSLLRAICALRTQGDHRSVHLPFPFPLFSANQTTLHRRLNRASDHHPRRLQIRHQIHNRSVQVSGRLRRGLQRYLSL
jgi:hypothetical protein